LGSSTHTEDFTPGTLKTVQVALVEPVAYLEDSVINWLCCGSQSASLSACTSRQQLKQPYKGDGKELCNFSDGSLGGPIFALTNPKKWLLWLKDTFSVASQSTTESVGWAR
jgi:hypothetical protein